MCLVDQKVNYLGQSCHKLLLTTTTTVNSLLCNFFFICLQITGYWLWAWSCVPLKQMRPPLPEDTPPELVFIVQSCWVEDPHTRPTFSQIIRMLNAVICTLPPAPAPEPPEQDTVPATMSTRGTITTTTSTRRGGKLSFLRQLFAAKKEGKSST